MSLTSILNPKRKESPIAAKANELAQLAVDNAKVSTKDLGNGAKVHVVEVDLNDADKNGLGGAIEQLIAAAGVKRRSFAEGVTFIEDCAREALDAIQYAKTTEKQRDLMMLGFSENFRRFATCVVNGHTDATEEQSDAVDKLADEFFEVGNNKDRLGKDDYVAMLKLIIA